MWPFIVRRLRAELDAANADRARLRGERDQFAEDRNAFRAAAQKAARQFDEASAQLADPDVHRKALAGALGAAADRTWDQLLKDTVRLAKEAEERMAESNLLHTELTRAKAEAVTLSGELDELRSGRRLFEGGTVRPRTESDELRQAKAHNAALDARLGLLTAANQACTCFGGAA